MLPRPLDTTLAFKAVCLSDALSGTDKCVAAAIIDSFNRRTGQCDPSFDRIAHLTGKSRRTVIRAVQRLERMRFVLKSRHGGHFHRNSYEPNWAYFREMEARWAARRATRHWEPNMSPSTVPKLCHVAGDASGIQTLQVNISKETSLDVPARTNQNAIETGGSKGNSRKAASNGASAAETYRQGNFKGPVFTSAAFAERSSAERRWNGSLMKRLVATPVLYGQVIEALDPELQDRATTAEMKQRGGGIASIVEELLKRGLKL